jgi:hypothetical protein
LRITTNPFDRQIETNYCTVVYQIEICESEKVRTNLNIEDLQLGLVDWDLWFVFTIEAKRMILGEIAICNSMVWGDSMDWGDTMVEREERLMMLGFDPCATK